MKFRCERDSLVEVLTTAGRAVSARTSAMALSGVRIESTGNHLAVVGTDLDLTVHASTEAIGITDGVCVAPARLLGDIVRSLEPGAVTIESEGDKVEIGAARSRFSLRTFPVDDFPTLPDPPNRPRSSRRAVWPVHSAKSYGPPPVTTPDPSSPGCSSRPRGAGCGWWPPTPTDWPCGTSTGVMP